MNNPHYATNMESATSEWGEVGRKLFRYIPSTAADLQYCQTAHSMDPKSTFELFLKSGIVLMFIQSKNEATHHIQWNFSHQQEEQFIKTYREQKLPLSSCPC